MTSVPGGHHRHGHHRHGDGRDHDGRDHDGGRDHDDRGRDGRDPILPLSHKVNDLISRRVEDHSIGAAPTITAGLHSSFATVSAGLGRQATSELRPATVSALHGGADDRGVLLFAYGSERGGVDHKHDENANFQAASGNSTLTAGNWSVAVDERGSRLPAVMSGHQAVVGAAEAGPDVGHIGGAVNYTLSDRVQIAFSNSEHHAASVILRFPS